MHTFHNFAMLFALTFDKAKQLELNYKTAKQILICQIFGTLLQDFTYYILQ